MPTPKQSQPIGIIVRKANGTVLADASVTLSSETETTPAEITNSNGVAVLDAGNLSSWSDGDIIVIKVTKTGHGTASLFVRLTSAPMADVEITMHNYNFMKHKTDYLVLLGALLATDDGEKVTVSNPLPVSTNPLDKYEPSDENVAEGLEYHGSVDKDGNWYILKYDLNAGTMRYAVGTTAYTTNWTNRASLTYSYFYEVF